MCILGQSKYPTATKSYTTEGDQNSYFLLYFLLFKLLTTILSIYQLAISVFLSATGHHSKLCFEYFETVWFSN